MNELIRTFGYCWDMAGVRNFYGEGYPNQRFYKPLGFRLDGSTFVAKTTPLHSRTGHPNAICLDNHHWVIGNAIGLHSPIGAEGHFRSGLWQQRTKPFAISFAAVGSTFRQRMEEVNEFAGLLRHFLPHFKAEVCLQHNVSCQNDGIERLPDELVEEVRCFLETVHKKLHKHGLKIAQMPKLGIETPISDAKKISDHELCDGLCVSNSISWGSFPDEIDWRSFFDQSGKSPLAKYGGGGFSGKPMLPLVVDWVSAARQESVRKPIVAGGGITDPHGATALFEAGASAVAVGWTMYKFRPFNMRRTVKHINRFGSEFASMVTEEELPLQWAN